ncbi:hypothetical protein SNOG_05770 [Parastagonospora nodorum SN15]|uniref:histidine kinase n=1 Tax=Phaeosphaeria nodorum (strain SN15 / ATCC MYA-4574 / FGSC 10173) TaxID=321614 RepID=Q0UR44_PHANO|nr:hypothetical protein SNOG_05770 [Parastagonospora nodorum SN15]EAT86834.2 hypothetical protein SNOG_05770 [Parastagonospora nodorum SN15]
MSEDQARRTIRSIPELKRESSREVLAAVGLLAALDIDDRPSFAIRIQSPPSQPSDADECIDLVYCNAAFTSNEGLLARVSGQLDAASIFAEHGQPQQAFRKWLRGTSDENDFCRRGNAYMFDGLIWTAITIKDHKITLKLNDKDVPFALLYAADDQHARSTRLRHYASTSSKERISLSAIPDASDQIEEGPQFVGFRSNSSYLKMSEDALFGKDLVEGFLILGINPRRPFDEEYKKFVQVMLRLLATSLASVVLFDEEVRENETAIGRAAEMQEQLLAELQMKEKRFQRFAERADIAIFIMDSVGKYTYRNQRWYDMFEVATDDSDAMGAWLNIAFPEDIAKCEAIFGKLVMHKEAVSFELKTKMPWVPPPDLLQPKSETTEHHRWILCSAYPELDSRGELVEIVGNVTDISKQKWAEDMQKIRTDVALESKQHLEHFIDTTSHEMRNPLSAIMQSADGILASYAAEADVPPSPYAWSVFLEQTLDAAQTIAQCAQHMRHIVDDILTISKLDSGLLVITPVDSRPESLLKHAVKMFDAEAKAARVELSYTVDQSYREMDLNWVSLDPTRLLQVSGRLLCHLDCRMGAHLVTKSIRSSLSQFLLRF